MINLNTPILKSEQGNIFHVRKADFDFDRNEVNFYWQIKDTLGAVMFDGNAILKDWIETIQNEEETTTVQHNDFTEWYQFGYPTHGDLVEKAAEIAGYSGEYVGGLI